MTRTNPLTVAFAIAMIGFILLIVGTAIGRLIEDRWRWVLLACALLGGTAQAQQLPPQIALQQLGHELFFDKSLSALGNISCASCHNPDIRYGYSDRLRVAVGLPGVAGAPLGIVGLRNTMGLLRVAHKENKLAFRDGRVDGLYRQCLAASTDPRVMGQPNVQSLVAQAAKNQRYQRLSQAAYAKPLDESIVRAALVAFIKGLNYEDLPADRLAAGLPIEVPDSVRRGWALAQKWCVSCHIPGNDWTDDEFHNIGISLRSGSNDRGRGLITGNPADDYAFITPTLAGCPHNPPYMHDGSLETLEQVVYYKASGGVYMARDGSHKRDRLIDPRIKRISLNRQEADDVVAWLKLAMQDPTKYPERKDPHQR